MWGKSRAFMVCLLSAALCLGVFAEDMGCLAAQRKEYYIVLNDTVSFAMTEQQYEHVMGIWDGKHVDGVVEALRGMFGADRIPAQVTRIQMRIYTYHISDDSEKDVLGQVGGGNTGVTGETTPPESDFEVLSGKLMRYRGDDEVVVIPDLVKYIEQGAFYNNSKVRKIIVPASVSGIGGFSFYKCSNLRCIEFAGKSNRIGNHMIYECGRLTNIVAPKASKEYKYAQKNGIPVFTASRTTFGRKRLRLLQGDREKLVLYNAPGKITWKSSNPKVLKISSGGTLICRKKGKARVTAQTDGKTFALVVTVGENSMDKRVRLIIGNSVKKGMTTREKIKAVHDWLIRHVKYDYDNYLRGRVPRVSHQAKGALLRGIAVCDGYSKAFQMVMKKLGIPCQIVTGYFQGGGHAWNRVRVDGKWRHIDVTFDDPIVDGKNTNTTPRYTYFLKTAAQMRRDHQW